jgi:hypothetical protein
MIVHVPVTVALGTADMADGTVLASIFISLDVYAPHDQEATEAYHPSSRDESAVNHRTNV